MLLQVVSLAGAAMILVAYVAIARGWLKPTHKSYSLLNLIGALLLLYVAIVDQRMGFILLESMWALVSIPPLFRSPTRPAAHA